MPSRRKTLTVLAAVLLGLGLAEGGSWVALAFLDDEAAPLQLEFDGEAGNDRQRRLREEIYRVDATCFFRLEPDLDVERTASKRIFDLRTNSLGLRGPEVLHPKPAGSLRVLCVGDSCTFGSGAGGDGTFPAQLQGVLAGALGDRAIEVINAGVPGYTSDQCLRYLESRGLELDPDAVVLIAGYNDASRATVGPKRGATGMGALTDRQYAATLQPPPRLGVLRLMRLLRGESAKSETPADEAAEIPARVPLDEYAENLARVADLCRDRGIVPVICAWPLQSQADPVAFPNDSRKGDLTPEYQAAAETTARAAGAVFIDLRPLVVGRPELFNDRVHMVAAGYAEVARAIADALVEQL